MKKTATTFLTSDFFHTGLTRQLQSSLKNTQRENDLAIASILLLPVLVDNSSICVYMYRTTSSTVYIEREYMQLQQLTWSKLT